MKICPNCQSKFPDDIFFCLIDGARLDDDEEKTLPFSETVTVENRNQLTTDQNKQFFPPPSPNYSQLPRRRTNPMAIVGGVLGVFLLIAGILAAAFVYSKKKTGWFPTPTPQVYVTPNQTPFRTPVTEEKVQLKIEQAGKVKGSFGQQFLKFMVTNPSEKIVIIPDLSVTLYQGDVKVGGARGESKLKYLKPGQTVPIWADLGYGNVKYTDAKTETSPMAKLVNKTEEQLFPQLTLSDTKMNVSKATSSFNNYNYSENWYKVAGVVENTNYETISPEIVVIFYDENSNIVGIEKTGISNLKRGEKQKFEVGVGETSELFGKPKKFEVIVVDSRS